MPWRDHTDPYSVLVSELMLQQTQVDRVRPKFAAFMAAFTTVEKLAEASPADILALWQGLGYNRRALYLHEAARQIVAEHAGVFPDSINELKKLPGIGPNTAGAIMAYAFNQPAIFVETNIRTVYLHHYFASESGVSDNQIADVLQRTLPKATPRLFYWALMDYGTELKKSGVKNNPMSKHYKKQPALKGSVREVRGAIIKLLVNTPNITRQEVMARYPNDPRVDSAIDGLIRDGLISLDDQIIHLTK